VSALHRRVVAFTFAAAGALVIACGSSDRAGFDDVPGGAPDGAGAGAFGSTDAGEGEGGICTTCSDDGTQVTTCDGTVLRQCQPGLYCGGTDCLPPCDAARANKASVGCDYRVIHMSGEGHSQGGCLVAFVANTWNTPVHITASFDGKPIDVGQYAKIPQGKGPSTTYAPYDPVKGLDPSEVAILFLAADPADHGTTGVAAQCPVPPAIASNDSYVHYYNSVFTGRAPSFSIKTDYPVVAYQMMPYGGGWAATTGATLLLPTSAWDTNYVGAMAYRSGKWGIIDLPASMAIVADEDNTKVTIAPTAAIASGYNVEATPANVPISYTMKSGEFIEFIQNDDLSGSIVQSDKPIAVYAGHTALRVPYDADYSDHAEQQLPPIRALGSEYAAASFRDRYVGVAEKRHWRLIGVVDGTMLSIDPPVPGVPSSMARGEVVEFITDVEFVVKSQGNDHPFLLLTYMSGSYALEGLGVGGVGDSDCVRIVPGEQYLKHYVFFTDPTYPETNLVIVRKKGKSGFADVELDCAGNLSGWAPIGSGGQYEFTRIDLSRHNFQAQGACDNGRHEMKSTEQFTVTVWGWGSPETRANATDGMPCDQTKRDNSCDVSYGYPAGENLKPINRVTVVPTPH
jgi:hypothetical protein